MHHFVFNGYTLVTAMESPDRPESCRFILRDITGRYCWEQTLVFDPQLATFKRIANHDENVTNSNQQDLAGITSITSPMVHALEHLSDRDSQEHVIQEQNALDTDDEDDMPKLIEETCVTNYVINESISEQLSNLEHYNELQYMHRRESVTIASQKKKPNHKSSIAHQPNQLDSQDQSDDDEPTSQSDSITNDSSSSLAIPSHSNPTNHQSDQDALLSNGNDPLVNATDEEQINEEDKVDYPLYDPEIDTDKTDMLEVLQHYVVNVFPECQEYSQPSVILIPDQKIDIVSIQEELIEQADDEDRLLEERTDFLEFVAITPPERKPDPTDPMATVVYKAFRALMSNMGYLSPVNRSSFVRLDPNHRFYRALRQLDKLTERETIKIGVVYVANGQESERKLMRNETASDAYHEFVQALGWDVDLSTHEGFMGGLDPSLTTGRTAPYYANATTEVIFHVVTKMPNKENDNQQIHKKRHVGNDNVHIVWSEHDRDYRPWTITSQFNFVHIVIYPLQYPLFRIQIHTKKNKDTNTQTMSPFGPLQDGMIVDKESLAPLVRMTAINANKAVRYQQPGYKKPYPTRRELINEIVERFKPVKMTNEEYMKGLFFDQCYAPMVQVDKAIKKSSSSASIVAGGGGVNADSVENTPRELDGRVDVDVSASMVEQEEEDATANTPSTPSSPVQVVVSIPASEAPAPAAVIVAADEVVENDDGDDEYDSEEEVAVIE
ncbi:hypothetical protein AKO1_009120 [Acrasis kona]|uniref:Rap-GAP domain-containing protein n=1 Tax=Acrasis kona TaxID=1008807 RepID=A0AAW2ZLK4_9EUKA